MDKRTEQVKALMEDQEFVNHLLTLESNEEVRKAFAEKGVEFSLEEVEAVAEAAFGGGELDESQLENVAGGIAWEIIAIVASGVALAANGMAEYNNYRKSKGKKPIW